MHLSLDQSLVPSLTLTFFMWPEQASHGALSCPFPRMAVVQRLLTPTSLIYSRATGSRWFILISSCEWGCPWGHACMCLRGHVAAAAALIVDAALECGVFPAQHPLPRFLYMLENHVSSGTDGRGRHVVRDSGGVQGSSRQMLLPVTACVMWAL
jgi:hypothetical protein